jgi:hypothetical protein
MGRKWVAGLALLGWLGTAVAQEAREDEAQEASSREDLPDNMDVFRETPVTDDTPVTFEEEAGVGGGGEAGTEAAPAEAGQQLPPVEESLEGEEPEPLPEW